MALVFLMSILPIPAAGENRLIRVYSSQWRRVGCARATHEAHIASVLQIASKYKIAASDIMQDFPEIESRGDGFFLRRTIQLTIRDLHSYDAMLFELYDSDERDGGVVADKAKTVFLAIVLAVVDSRKAENIHRWRQ